MQKKFSLRQKLAASGILIKPELLAGWYQADGAIYVRLEPSGIRYAPPRNVLNKFGRIYHLPRYQLAGAETLLSGMFFLSGDDYLMLIDFPAERGRNLAPNVVKWPEGIPMHLPADTAFRPLTFPWPESELTAAELNRQANIFSGRISA